MAGANLSRRQFLRQYGLSAAGGTLGGLVALAVPPASNVSWEVD